MENTDLGSDELDIFIDFKNYENDASVFKRTAARAIISSGKKYLLIKSKYGDYKFPGGGLEEGEGLIGTLVREIREETGYQIVRNSIKKYGVTREKRKGKLADVMMMDSHYYFCEVGEEVLERILDPYEEEYGYQNVWMTLEEALEKNNQITDIDACPWIVRDIEVMERLIKEVGLSCE